jgi:hypothetical protein
MALGISRKISSASPPGSPWRIDWFRFLPKVPISQVSRGPVASHGSLTANLGQNQASLVRGPQKLLSRGDQAPIVGIGKALNCFICFVLLFGPSLIIFNAIIVSQLLIHIVVAVELGHLIDHNKPPHAGGSSTLSRSRWLNTRSAGGSSTRQGRSCLPGC